MAQLGEEDLRNGSHIFFKIAETREKKWAERVEKWGAKHLYVVDNMDRYIKMDGKQRKQEVEKGLGIIINKLRASRTKSSQMKANDYEQMQQWLQCTTPEIQKLPIRLIQTVTLGPDCDIEHELPKSCKEGNHKLMGEVTIALMGWEARHIASCFPEGPLVCEKVTLRHTPTDFNRHRMFKGGQWTKLEETHFADFDVRRSWTIEQCKAHLTALRPLVRQMGSIPKHWVVDAIEKYDPRKPPVEFEPYQDMLTHLESGYAPTLTQIEAVRVCFLGRFPEKVSRYLEEKDLDWLLADVLFFDGPNPISPRGVRVKNYPIYPRPSWKRNSLLETVWKAPKGELASYEKWWKYVDETKYKLTPGSLSNIGSVVDTGGNPDQGSARNRNQWDESETDVQELAAREKVIEPTTDEKSNDATKPAPVYETVSMGVIDRMKTQLESIDKYSKQIQTDGQQILTANQARFEELSGIISRRLESLEKVNERISAENQKILSGNHELRQMVKKLENALNKGNINGGLENSRDIANSKATVPGQVKLQPTIPPIPVYPMSYVPQGYFPNLTYLTPTLMPGSMTPGLFTTMGMNPNQSKGLDNCFGGLRTPPHSSKKRRSQSKEGHPAVRQKTDQLAVPEADIDDVQDGMDESVRPGTEQ